MQYLAINANDALISSFYFAKSTDLIAFTWNGRTKSNVWHLLIFSEADWRVRSIIRI
ncbi:hypothetical protein PSAC2689_90243 [Paraburkholderia sacchari]